MNPSSTRGLAAVTLAASLLAGCNAMNQIADIGSPPPLTPVKDPVQQAGYTPVSFPMPAPIRPEPLDNSMWRAGARAFFKDQRASSVGDILTAVIDIQDKGEISTPPSAVGPRPRMPGPRASSVTNRRCPNCSPKRSARGTSSIWTV